MIKLRKTEGVNEMSLVAMQVHNMGEKGVLHDISIEGFANIQTVDEPGSLSVALERAALDNPDLPLDFINEILISKAQGLTFAEPFIPE